MILTELPDLPPRPETPANAAFRRDYVARWTKENTLLCGETRLAEYPRVMHPLSIKMAWGGREVYRLRRRDVHVREGSYLVLNDGDEYGSTLKSERPATSFSIFLRRGLAEEIVAARRLGLERCLEQAVDAAATASFSPHLRADDRHVTPRMRFIYEQRDGGRAQPALARRASRAAGRRPAARRARGGRAHVAPARRQGVDAGRAGRRLRLAADHMESHYEQALPLETLARVACMSTYHFVRYFALLHGATPHAYLVGCRAAAARRMLADGITDHRLIAERSGFGSRSSLYRALAGRSKTARPARRHAGRPGSGPGVLSS